MRVGVVAQDDAGAAARQAADRCQGIGQAQVISEQPKARAGAAAAPSQQFRIHRYARR
jgi:hypothetical protein